MARFSTVSEFSGEMVDPHHHLWGPEFMGGLAGSYLLDDLHADTDATPAVGGTVFIECSAGYRTDGPERLKPVGETEFVAAMAETSGSTTGATILGIVGHADLTLPLDQLDEVLDAHERAAGGRFRGIRDALACAPPATPVVIAGGADPDRAANPDFRRGVAHLGDRGLTYDTWQYHTQLPALTDLARAVPQTTIICDHLSTPLGVGRWEDRDDEVFAEWSPAFEELAGCENVIAKIGGLAMPDNGFFDISDDGDPGRPDVDDYLGQLERWYLHAIDCFGPSRSMFESNFPVDRMCVDYPVVWEAFGRIADRFDEAEQADLFAQTARRIYRLP